MQIDEDDNEQSPLKKTPLKIAFEKSATKSIYLSPLKSPALSERHLSPQKGKLDFDHHSVEHS